MRYENDGEREDEGDESSPRGGRGASHSAPPAQLRVYGPAGELVRLSIPEVPLQMDEEENVGEEEKVDEEESIGEEEKMDGMQDEEAVGMSVAEDRRMSVLLDTEEGAGRGGQRVEASSAMRSEEGSRTEGQTVMEEGTGLIEEESKKGEEE